MAESLTIMHFYNKFNGTVSGWELEFELVVVVFATFIRLQLWGHLDTSILRYGWVLTHGRNI